jgi:predicted ATPase
MTADLRFRLLRNQRSAPERHRTLEATVAWSYDLLEPRQRQVFERLSVFADGFTLAASELVCVADPSRHADVTVAVVELAEKSMLRIDTSGRYRQLETVRQFAAERLDDGKDRDRVRRRHALHFAAFARGARRSARRRRRRMVAGLAGRWANVRAAFGWAVGKDIDVAVTDGATVVVPPGMTPGRTNGSRPSPKSSGHRNTRLGQRPRAGPGRRGNEATSTPQRPSAHQR